MVKQKLLHIIKEHPTSLLLVLISIVLCITNYVPNTFLTGWDTLHPEFNYRIYLSRIIDGVWQEHQGLGDVATQAHASELPRILILMIFSVFLKMSQVRYAYVFLMLIIGPLGVYAFLKKVFLKHLPVKQQEFGSFAGGLFYLLNLVVLQQFYVPLEMFLTHYGFLGWFFFYLCDYFEKRNRSSLLKFVLVCLVSSSQAHTATLFYALVLCLVAFLLALFLSQEHEKRKGILIKSVIAIVFMLVVNSFWLLPNIYFAINQGANIQKSKIHRLFSEEAFLQNVKFGNINDIALLRGFLFNWGQYVGDNKFDDLLNAWIVHSSKPLVLPLGYAFFALVVFGMVISIKKREKYALAVFAIFAVCLFFLINVNPPFGFIFVLLQKYVPLFKEAFRFPFTKFSILLVFTYAVFFGYALATILKFFVNVHHGEEHIRRTKKFRELFIYSITTGALVYYMLPAFFGNFISSTMKVNIPQRYFDMFKYFDSQQEFGRVANLPVNSFWGWVYYNWNSVHKTGYQGAGFLWFGIKQPLMDREFDRWGLDNEQYFHEMSYAVYSENVFLLENVLEKYKIRWLLLDKSVMAPGADQKTLFYPQLDKLLKSSTKISLEKDFGDGLFVYKYKPSIEFSLKDISTSYTEVGKPFFKELIDTNFVKETPYITTSTDYYPFTGITTDDENLNTKYISSDSTNIYFNDSVGSRNLTGAVANDYFQFDTLIKTVANSDLEVTLRDSSGILNYISIKNILPKPSSDLVVIRIGDTLFYVDIKTVSSTDTSLGVSILNPTVVTALSMYSVNLGTPVNFDFMGSLEVCSQVANLSTYAVENVSEGFKLTSKGAVGCVTAPLKQFITTPLATNDIVLIKSDTDSIKSNPAICLFEDSTGLCKNAPFSKSVAFGLTQDVPLDNYFLRFSSGTITDKTEEFGVSYRNIHVVLPQKILSQTIDFSSVLKDASVVKAPFTFKKVDYLTGSVVNVFHDPRSCQTGSVDLDSSNIEIAGKDFISYKSTKESLCDSSELPLLDHKVGYVLEIVSRNNGGLPLRMCLTNEYSKRCDLYVSLGKNKDFTSQYYFIPPIGSGYGYTANLSNMLLGDTPGKNDIKYISVTPVPYTYLRTLHDLSIPQPKSGKLLVYNQAYEKGWMAFCGFKLCNATHVKVNNWANGWILNGSDSGALTPSITVIFWPQILEYFGLFLLVLLLLFLTL